jgi:branched-chain amino acid transport system permease protein
MSISALFKSGWVQAAGGSIAWLAILAISAVFLSPFLLFIAAGILVSILYAESVSFSIGFGGVATFGNQTFFGAAGYLVAWLSLSHGVHSLLLLIVVGMAAGIVTSLATVVLVRGETGFVYGMLTLAIGQTVYSFVSGTSVFWGTGGLAGVPRGDFFGLNLNTAITYYWFLGGVVLVVMLGLFGIRRSSFGQILSATRQNAVRAQALGVPVNRYKAVTVLISGAVAGIAGTLYAITYNSVDPSMYYWVAGAVPILAGLLGGVRTLIGPVVGATIFGGVTYAFSLDPNLGELYISLIILGLFLLMPEGIVPGVIGFGRWSIGTFSNGELRRARPWRARQGQ